MHLLVLSAFRQELYGCNVTFVGVESQCTFWCSVLSDEKTPVLLEPGFSGLNAPFGAQCFPTFPATVSRPLLV